MPTAAGAPKRSQRDGWQVHAQGRGRSAWAGVFCAEALRKRLRIVPSSPELTWKARKLPHESPYTGERSPTVGRLEGLSHPGHRGGTDLRRYHRLDRKSVV